MIQLATLVLGITTLVLCVLILVKVNKKNSGQQNPTLSQSCSVRMEATVASGSGGQELPLNSSGYPRAISIGTSSKTPPSLSVGTKILISSDNNESGYSNKIQGSRDTDNAWFFSNGWYVTGMFQPVCMGTEVFLYF